MGIDMKEFVKDRDSAFIAFVMNDDWEPVRRYCDTYKEIPNEVKVKAAIKCMKLGFTPFMLPFESKEG